MRFKQLFQPPSSLQGALVCFALALPGCDSESDREQDRSTKSEDTSRAVDASRGDDETATDRGDSGAGSTQDMGDAGSPTDGKRDAGADMTPDASPASKDAGGSTGKDAGTTTRTPCGGFAGLSCGSGLFCNYEAPAGQGCDGQIADAAGVCDSVPDVCAELSEPVCGCDGKTYANACEAHGQSMSVAKKGACAAESTSCDRRKLKCRRAEPMCPEGQVVEIVGTCFGDCVPVDACACSEAAACPQPEKYTCHMSARHCGPYVN